MASIKKYNGSSFENAAIRKYSIATDTITTLPADVYADGNNATVGLVGNMAQTGTPSPTTPIPPQETGERTANLFDKSTLTQGSITNEGTVDSTITYRQTTGFLEIKPSQIYTISGKLKGETCNWIYATYDSNKSLITRDILRDGNYTFTSENNAKYVRLCGYNLSITTLVSSSDYTECQLNEGAEALPYEPYGIKIPILSASITTPVYLGEVQTTRNIKKLVLTGKEGWKNLLSDNTRFYLDVITPDYIRADSQITYMCSHFISYEQTTSATLVPNLSMSMSSGTAQRLYITDANYTTDADFKAYLAQQYAAGTPVTVWYVLTESTTGIVNEPLRKIGNYADTVSGITIPTITGADSFDVLTTLKPSEVSLSYTGWHNAIVKEWDGTDWQ